MSTVTGFNLEDMINGATLKGGGDTQEPKVEQLVSKLRRLQQATPFKTHSDKYVKINTPPRTVCQSLLKCYSHGIDRMLGKRVLEEEVKDIRSVSDSLKKELENLQSEAYQLEGVHKEKEELCRKLQFQCEESEQDCTRQLKQNEKSEDLLEQYRCGIQEFKLKQRKQRMKFENQLQQLMEQHKNLHSVFTPERLPGEIEGAENSKCQLLSAEQLKLAQLCRLDEELEDVRKQEQLGKNAAETQEQ